MHTGARRASGSRRRLALTGVAAALLVSAACGTRMSHEAVVSASGGQVAQAGVTGESGTGATGSAGTSLPGGSGTVPGADTGALDGPTTGGDVTAEPGSKSTVGTAGGSTSGGGADT